MRITDVLLFDNNIKPLIIKWFQKEFPHGGTYIDVLECAAQNNKFNFAKKMVEVFGPTLDFLETKKIDNQKNLYFPGNMIVNGSLYVHSLIIGGDLIVKKKLLANSSVYVKGGITAGHIDTIFGDLLCESFINCHGNIEVMGNIRAKTSIVAKNFIQSDKDIVCDGDIRAEFGYIAANKIKSGGMIQVAKYVAANGEVVKNSEKTKHRDIKARHGIYIK